MLREVGFSAIYKLVPPAQLSRMCPSLLRLLGASGISAHLCSQPIELSKAMIRYIRSRGGKGRYLMRDPTVFVLKSPPPPELKDVLKPSTSPRRLREVLGFSSSDTRYIFGENRRRESPFAILEEQPYSCVLDRLEVDAYYAGDAYKKLLEEIERVIRSRHPGRLKFNNMQLKDFSDLYRDLSVKLAVIDEDAFNSSELAEAKYLSYVNGISRLQLINYQSFMSKCGGDSFEYCVANIVSALYFKAGCTPYYVWMPSMRYNPTLHKALYVGIGLVRKGNKIIKGVAYLMTHLGEVKSFAEENFVLESERYEFSENEVESFIRKVLDKGRDYITRAGEKAQLLVVFRTRMFHEEEARRLIGKWQIEGKFEKALRRVFNKDWWTKYANSVLLASVYKTKDTFGADVAVEAVYKGGSGTWFVQLEGFENAAQLDWYSTTRDSRTPLLAYLYARSLDFASLNKQRVLPAPVGLAKNYAFWLKNSKPAS